MGTTSGTKAAKALPAMAGSATDGGAPGEDLEMSAGDVAAMRRQEAVTKANLLAEEQVEVFAPKSLILGPTLVAQINGVRFEVPLNKKVKVPKSIAALVNARVSGAAALEEAARSRSGE